MTPLLLTVGPTINRERLLDADTGRPILIGHGPTLALDRTPVILSDRHRLTGRLLMILIETPAVSYVRLATRPDVDAAELSALLDPLLCSAPLTYVRSAGGKPNRYRVHIAPTEGAGDDRPHHQCVPGPRRQRLPRPARRARRQRTHPCQVTDEVDAGWFRGSTATKVANTDEATQTAIDACRHDRPPRHRRLPALRPHHWRAGRRWGTYAGRNAGASPRTPRRRTPP